MSAGKEAGRFGEAWTLLFLGMLVAILLALAVGEMAVYGT